MSTPSTLNLMDINYIGKGTVEEVLRNHRQQQQQQ